MSISHFNVRTRVNHNNITDTQICELHISFNSFFKLSKLEMVEITISKLEEYKKILAEGV